MAWGLVTTVKAPAEKLLAFLAHHLDLGATQISVYFDDPADPAFAVLSAMPALQDRVTFTRCDAQRWGRDKPAPERHQNRQARNAQHAYRRSGLDWLGHIDVDEFLQIDQPIDACLAALHPDQSTLRLEPFEAMHDPTLPDDIYSARMFRGALKASDADLRGPVLGAYHAILPEGLLSHANGKMFFRCGVPGLSPRLHGAFIDGERLPAPPFDPRLRLLHFHAQDRAAWEAALPFRLTRGAYQYHPALHAFLSSASPAETAAFYDSTQMLSAEKAAVLAKAGRLVEASLDLRAKVAKLTAPVEGASP